MPTNAFLVARYATTPMPVPAVTPEPTATPTPVPTATPAATAMVSLTSAPTPTEAEETQRYDAEAPVPGFELVFSLLMLIIVAYMLRKHKV